MSYADGIAAINLEMPGRVPRTEYSAESHWGLVKAVTGIDINTSSSKIDRENASRAFIKAWNYDFIWNVLIHNQIFDGFRTSMGHAEYAAGGSDFDDNITCPFKEPEEVLSFDPWETYGPRNKKTLIEDFENHYRLSCENNPHAVNMTGIYVTCVSGLIEIFGWEMLLTAAGIDPHKFGNVTNQYASWIQQYFDALAETDVPVVMIHDDIVWSSGPVFHPEWYRKYIFPNYKKYFSPLIESGKKIIYTSDGTYDLFIDDIVQCGVDGFVMEPTTNMEYIAQKYGKSHVFIGNADHGKFMNPLPSKYSAMNI